MRKLAQLVTETVNTAFISAISAAAMIIASEPDARQKNNPIADSEKDL